MMLAAAPSQRDSTEVEQTQFQAQVLRALPTGTILKNPGGGTSAIISVSETDLSYKRGNSTIRVSLNDLFQAYCRFKGSRVTSPNLKEFMPSVFDSSARPAGHSCNCTFLFLLLGEMGLAGEIGGSGVRGDPFCVDVRADPS